MPDKIGLKGGDAVENYIQNHQTDMDIILTDLMCSFLTQDSEMPALEARTLFQWVRLLLILRLLQMTHTFLSEVMSLE